MNKARLTIWATLIAACASFCWGSACFATSDSAVNAPTAPLQPEELWPAIVSLFSTPDGRVDLETLKSALHVDPAADSDPKDRKSHVFRGTVGQDKNLGYLFVNLDRSRWSIVLFWLERPDDLKSFKIGNPPNDLCIDRDRIESSLTDEGWQENFGYNRYKFPTIGVITAFAIFKKGSVELSVNLTRDGGCFYYLKAAPVPLSKFDLEHTK